MCGSPDTRVFLDKYRTGPSGCVLPRFSSFGLASSAGRMILSASHTKFGPATVRSRYVSGPLTVRKAASEGFWSRLRVDFSVRGRAGPCCRRISCGTKQDGWLEKSAVWFSLQPHRKSVQRRVECGGWTPGRLGLPAAPSVTFTGNTSHMGLGHAAS